MQVGLLAPGLLPPGEEPGPHRPVRVVQLVRRLPRRQVDSPAVLLPGDADAPDDLVVEPAPGVVPVHGEVAGQGLPLRIHQHRRTGPAFTQGMDDFRELGPLHKRLEHVLRHLGQLVVQQGRGAAHRGADLCDPALEQLCLLVGHVLGREAGDERARLAQPPGEILEVVEQRLPPVELRGGGRHLRRFEPLLQTRIRPRPGRPGTA